MLGHRGQGLNRERRDRRQVEVKSQIEGCWPPLVQAAQIKASQSSYYLAGFFPCDVVDQLAAAESYICESGSLADSRMRCRAMPRVGTTGALYCTYRRGEQLALLGTAGRGRTRRSCEQICR